MDGADKKINSVRLGKLPYKLDDQSCGLQVPGVRKQMSDIFCIMDAITIPSNREEVSFVRGRASKVSDSCTVPCNQIDGGPFGPPIAEDYDIPNSLLMSG
jgi:hypothetical protein